MLLNIVFQVNPKEEIDNMFETDKNMIKAIDLLKSSGEINFKQVAYDVIGWDKSRINKLKNQDKENYKQSFHFSAEDIRVFCEYFKLNVNFIYGFETHLFRNRAK